MKINKEEAMICIEGIRKYANQLGEDQKEEIVSHYHCMEKNYKECRDKDPKADHEARIKNYDDKGAEAVKLVEKLAESFLE